MKGRRSWTALAGVAAVAGLAAAVTLKKYRLYQKEEAAEEAVKRNLLLETNQAELLDILAQQLRLLHVPQIEFPWTGAIRFEWYGGRVVLDVDFIHGGVFLRGPDGRVQMWMFNAVDPHSKHLQECLLNAHETARLIPVPS